MSDTSLTGNPMSLIAFAVPPLATNFSPTELNFFAKLSKPVLFETLKIAKKNYKIVNIFKT